MAKLPLQIRRDIRDEWENGNSSLQLSRKELTGILGLETQVHPNWEHLWQILEKQFPHGDGFILTISNIIKAWCDELAMRLGQDDFNAWSDKFLNKISGISRVYIEVITWPNQKLKNEWNADRAVFIISIPETNLPNELVARQGFSRSFKNIFQPTTASISDPDWDDVGVSTEGRHQPAVGILADQTGDRLPTFEMLARPEHLYDTALPYWLLVQSSGSALVIQGSHSGSLELIAEYFTKWAKKIPNVSDDQPMLRVQLKDSCFGLGAYYDTVEIQPTRRMDYQYTPNPVLVITLIQSVLGYSLEYQDRNVWHFKREKAFI